MLFREVAAISGPGVAAMLLDYLERPPGIQTLASMGWREIQTPEGVDFKFGWPQSKPKSGA